MQNSFGQRVGNIIVVTVIALCLLAALLWASAVALEPVPVGPANAPDPAVHPDAVIQVYGADVWGMRGRFAIHTWVATKARNAEDYQIYQVVGWRLRRRGTALSIEEGNPSRTWFGSEPILLHDVRGARAEDLIDDVHQAALSYPFAKFYKMWPGPNSNSFTAWIGLEVPELGLSLPAKALGKSWMINEHPALTSAH